MAAQRKKDQINLLPEVFAGTVSGRILIWILSTFRIIVIITEVIVIAAFISRFWLDAKNTDLSEEILQDKALITSEADFEKEFKDIQNRLIIYNAYSTDKGKIVDSINSIIASKPPEIIFSSLKLDPAGASIQAESPSEISIQQFFVNLKSNGKFDEVSIGSVSSSKDDSTLIFNITVSYKKV